MNIQTIKESYINTSGNIYDSEFINLANIKLGKINFDDNTFFLSENKKNKLNSEPIERYDDAIYIFNYKNSYGLIANLDIQEYINENIKCHELVLPDIIQGMISNFHLYNSETAPVSIIHEEFIDLEKLIKIYKCKNKYSYGNINIYCYTGYIANEILKFYKSIKIMYVADGHHRLYTNSIINNKSSVLTCFMSFSFVEVLAIHRIIRNVDASSFEKAKDFMQRMLGIYEESMFYKGYIKITYQDETFLVKLKDVDGDLFWNNDVYRLNTQIISTAFRIQDFSKIEYLLETKINEKKKYLNKNDVLLEVNPLLLDEFKILSSKNCILPPKSTCFMPKFPSFLIFKKYK